MCEVKPYSIFSQIYNHTLKHVDYKKWSLFILNSLFPYKPKSILDLGCGTGELLFFMPNSLVKYGIDQSTQMLEIAKQRNPNTSFHQKNITNFDLEQNFDLITCTHDTINYLLTNQELEVHFQKVFHHLCLNGFYFFDVSSEYNLKYNFHKKVIRKNFNDLFLEWENEYLPEKKQIISILSFQKGNNYWRETHIQKLHSPEEISLALQKAKLKVLKIGSDYEAWDILPQTSLINYLVQKI